MKFAYLGGVPVVEFGQKGPVLLLWGHPRGAKFEFNSTEAFLWQIYPFGLNLDPSAIGGAIWGRGWGGAQEGGGQTIFWGFCRKHTVFGDFFAMECVKFAHTS